MRNCATIQVSKKDKERLKRLAKKTGCKKLSEAFRLALSAAEREIDAFHGDIDVLLEAHKYVRSVGGDVSENVNEFLAESLSE